VLVLDVLDDRIPASIIIDLISVAGCVNDVKPQAHTILLDDVRHGLDFCCRPNGLIGCHATLGVDQVGCEDGVDEGRLAQPGLANADDVELETALQQLSLNLRCDAVETNVASREDGVGLLRHTGSSHGELIDGIG